MPRLRRERCRRWRRFSGRGRRAWAAAGPAISDCGTRRDSGPRRGTRMLPQGQAVRADALQNEGRGMSRRDHPADGARGRQPRHPQVGAGVGGRAGLPRTIRPLRLAMPPRRLPRPKCGQGRVSCRACLSCDSCLLESRSPPRDASAGRSWRWPGCCPRQRSRPSPGRLGWRSLTRRMASRQASPQYAASDRQEFRGGS